MSTSRRARLAVATTAAALTVVLTGCGVAGTGFNPGVAAQVDDRTVTTDRVDDVAGTFCDAVESVTTEGESSVPLSYFRSFIAGQLALALAAEQMADDYGVEPTSDYDKAVAAVEEQTTTLTDEQREAVIAVNSAPDYIAAVELAVGRQLLAEEGVADPADQQAGQRGVEAFVEWLDDHDVELNPEYGMAIENANLVPADTQLSFPVGDAAKAGQAEEPDADYTKGLPESQRCG